VLCDGGGRGERRMQAVEAVDRCHAWSRAKSSPLFPWAASQAEGQRIPLGGTSSVQIAAVLDLVEQVPDELITLNAEDYSALRVCVVGLRQKVSRWLARGDDLFDHISGLPPLNPITLIRQCLIKCPDESPTPGTVELALVGDQDLRESIRLEISAADRDLANGEWKGATVLAGSAVEALLLWALQKHEKRQPGRFLARRRRKRPAGS
jgi:hypothetical protein